MAKLNAILAVAVSSRSAVVGSRFLVIVLAALQRCRDTPSCAVGRCSQRVVARVGIASRRARLPVPEHFPDDKQTVAVGDRNGPARSFDERGLLSWS